MRYRAAWVLPIAGPPIRDGWVQVESGWVVALGQGTEGQRRSDDEVDLGSRVILPGLVNAHTHLELSWMRGRIPPTARFPDWIRALLDLRRGRNETADPEAGSAMVRAVEEGRRCGTALVGDISNTMASAPVLAASSVSAVVFKELIGFGGGSVERLATEATTELMGLPISDRIRYSLAAHAPYSVSPALFATIRSAIERGRLGLCSVHLGESSEEVEFLEGGGGPWRVLLEQLGGWDSSWSAPACDPVEYLDRLGFLDQRLLVVHGVQLRPPALARLAERDVTLVTCPRGNILTGAGPPPVADFYASGVRVAVGTDSLASVPDLNLFSELAELRRLAPGVPAAALLESATFQGARALGFGDELGTIEPGKRAELIAVEIPRGISDPQEHLLSGIAPTQVRWLSAG